MLTLIKRQLMRLRINYQLHRKRLYIRAFQPSTGDYVTSSFPLNFTTLVAFSRGLSKLYAIAGVPSLGVVEFFALLQDGTLDVCHTLNDGSELTLFAATVLSQYEIIAIDMETNNGQQ